MFKDNLKTIRKEKGLSQEFLAKELNVVRQTISKWEKGLSIPDGDMLIKISQILDTPVEVLLGCEISLENKDEVTQALQLQIINNLLENSSRRGGRMSGTMLLGLFISIVGLDFSVSIMVLATFNNVYLSGYSGILGLIQGYGAMTLFVISIVAIFIGIIIWGCGLYVRYRKAKQNS